jgi:hypothetical protein
MSRGGRVHDKAILDALEEIGPAPFEGDVWRVTRKGRDAAKGSSAAGRWSPAGAFEVLYTSLDPEGALAETGYRLSLEPVWPSRIEHEIHRIGLRLGRALRLADLAELSRLGVDTARYGSFDYAATQAIASAARFLEFDGLMVPGARYDCSNLVVFLDRIGDYVFEVRESKPVDWPSWRKK